MPDQLTDRQSINPEQNIFIAFGGNIGDVLSHFDSARTAIAQLPGTSISDVSLLYRTPPLGPSGQADYYNAVLAIQSCLSPLTLLDELQDIESEHHRIRAEHWGPRTLDLDIIAIANQIIESNRLIVPHKEMHQRQFVLRPLCDIAPNWQHPQLQRTTSELLQALLQTGETVLPKGIIW